MRLLTLALIAIAAASPAAAQTWLEDLHADNRLLARQEQARQRALAADREAMMSEARVRTAFALDSLSAARLAPTPSFSAPIEPAPLDPALAADIEAVANAQAKALEESNARMRAITQDVNN